VTDVAHLAVNDEDVVVVHGGSTAVDDALEQMGKEPEYVESPSGVTGRFTDRETMDVFEMAMGKVNTDLVAAFENAGVPAVGLNGVDGKLLSGPRKSAVRVVEDGKRKIRRGEHSGTIEAVNTDLLEAQLDAGYVPVVSVPMFAKESDGDDEDVEWTPVNADADRAAAAVAGALDATLVVLTDVEGVYADPDDPSSLIEEVLTPADLDGAKEAAEGFMTKKVLAATEALEGGAEEVVVSDANRRDPIVAALDGAGTHFSPEALS